MPLTIEQRNTQPLFELAEEYHHRTEEYDRTVCTGPIKHGGILPSTGKEHALINRNAKAIMEEIVSRAEYIGFNRKEMQGMISQVGIRYSYRPLMEENNV